MTIEERLEKVEQELSRASRRNRRLLAGVVVCIVLAVGAWAMPRPAALLMQDAAKKTKEVRTSSLVIEDEKGRVRVTLGMHRDVGPSLTMYDENGKTRLLIGASSSMP